MRTSARSALIAAAALAAFANPITAMARPLNMADFIASYAAAQEKGVTNPAQDYIDSFSRQRFTAGKRVAGTVSADDPAKSYIESFGAPAAHSATSDDRRTTLNQGLTEEESSLLR